jgi:hypothetical protein
MTTVTFHRTTCTDCKGLAPIDHGNGDIEHCDTCKDTGFIDSAQWWQNRLAQLRLSGRAKAMRERLDKARQVS